MKADQNATVAELRGEVPKNGLRYLDLVTGELLSEIPSAKKPKDEPKPTETKRYTEDDLKGMSMKELRKIGATMGAKDTKKSELIAEILDKQ